MQRKAPLIAGIVMIVAIIVTMSMIFNGIELLASIVPFPTIYQPRKLGWKLALVMVANCLHLVSSSQSLSDLRIGRPAQIIGSS